MTRPARILALVLRSRLASVALAAALALVAGPACSGGDGKRAAPPPPATSPALSLAVEGVRVDSMRDPAPELSAEMRATVAAAVEGWLKAVVAAPDAPAIDSLFTAEALARIGPGAPERPVLLEEPPPPVGAWVPEVAKANLVGLAGQDGEVGLVTAVVEFTVLVGAPPSRARVSRVGELLLVPADGGWRIDSFDLSASREPAP